MTIPKSVQKFMEEITELCGETHKEWAINFNHSFSNTLETTLKVHDDGTTFLLTGDIPAMWLRDSTAQMRPYLVLVEKDEAIRNLIAGLVRKQMYYINLDPYANAFNESENFAGHQSDHTNFNSAKGWIWERKYEIDSLCYPVQLAYLLYKNTGYTEHFDEVFVEAASKILDVFEIEQNHEKSEYRFVRDTERLEDTLPREGRGTAVAYTGMTWSGFRPSDDACQYGYLVPSNMFAVVVLDYLVEIFTNLIPNDTLACRAEKLCMVIRDGLENHAKTTNQKGETIWAYEVDGLGQASIMDDSNVPNLMAAPYLGFCEMDDACYLQTRETLLSQENPFYYEGTYACGIGSSHTPENYVWPIAMAMEGLTSLDKKEKRRILDQLVATDAGTHLMHEGFDVDNPKHYTREWFSWANMMFCELVMDYFDIRVKR